VGLVVLMLVLAWLVLLLDVTIKFHAEDVSTSQSSATTPSASYKAVDDIEQLKVNNATSLHEKLFRLLLSMLPFRGLFVCLKRSCIVLKRQKIST